MTLRIPTRKPRGALPLVALALFALTGTATATAAPGPGRGTRAGTAAGTTAGMTAPPTRPVAASEDLGVWRVRRDGEHGFAVSWTSARRLPVTGARPQILRGATELGPTTVSKDDRTVTVRVRAVVAPDPQTLDVRLSGRVLDEPAKTHPDTQQPGRGGSSPGTRAREAVTAPLQPGALLDVDPGRTGAFTVTSSDYTLPGFTFHGMTSPLEMQGHVVRPADGQLTADAPLVLFLHGRHESCYAPRHPDRYTVGWPCSEGMRPIPSDLGYDYVQRLLASQGFVTVSIAANGINAQDGEALDGGAAARGALVRRHLRQWTAWAEDGTYPVDMQNVVLVGHSRGGEGVNRASEETPLDAPYRIVGQVLLAPTNFARQTTAYVPTVTVLPYCDGDVSDLQGQTYTDRARDLTPDDTALHTTVLVMGADHNFFNTEWTPGLSEAPSADDWSDRGGVCGKGSPTRLTAGEQRKVAKAYVAGAVQLMTGVDQRTLPMFDGSRVRVASIGDADVRTQALGGGRTLVEPGRDITRIAGHTDSTTAQICRGVVGNLRPTSCGRFADASTAPHWTDSAQGGAPSAPAIEMTWSRYDAHVDLALDKPLDLTGRQSLDLRTVVDPTVGDVRLRVELVDELGRSAGYTSPQGGLVPALPRGRKYDSLGKYLAQDVRIPLADLEPQVGLDLSQIRGIRIVGSPKQDYCHNGKCLPRNGRIWILDAAAVTAGPPPAVPAERLPVVDIGTARRTEGDGKAPAYVEVPYTVTGALARPARFVVTTLDTYDGTAGKLIVVDVPTGASHGTFAVGYQPNRIDDMDERVIQLSAYAVRGVMPRKSVGRAVIADDDPAPTIAVTRVRAGIREGQTAAWKVTLAHPVGYDVYPSARFLRGPAGPELTLGDLSHSWVTRELGAGGMPGHTPLTGRRFSLFGQIPAGRRTMVFRVPTRRDRAHERTETVTLEVSTDQPGLRAAATVRVRNR